MICEPTPPRHDTRTYARARKHAACQPASQPASELLAPVPDQPTSFGYPFVRPQTHLEEQEQEQEKDDDDDDDDGCVGYLGRWCECGKTDDAFAVRLSLLPRW